MKIAQQKLRDYLEIKGWDIASITGTDLEWWADEIWELRSRWSPEGVKAFVTFLVDPQHDGLRKKGQYVWGIGVSARPPASRAEAEGACLSLTSIAKKQYVENFLERLAQLRAGVPNEATGGC
jgi:hypothetical protein